MEGRGQGPERSSRLGPKRARQGVPKAASEEDMVKQVQALGWKQGPIKSALGTRASIDVPAHAAILGSKPKAVWSLNNF